MKMSYRFVSLLKNRAAYRLLSNNLAQPTALMERPSERRAAGALPLARWPVFFHGPFHWVSLPLAFAHFSVHRRRRPTSSTGKGREELLQKYFSCVLFSSWSGKLFIVLHQGTNSFKISRISKPNFLTIFHS